MVRFKVSPVKRVRVRSQLVIESMAARRIHIRIER